ncbi:hypothetical protein [Pseudoxanthomonas sp. USHLN014]|uniref:hypothetical protein n=1 Tax=Pseudoxanthomonas sp. USHLN014 TaxID=3081297 RepID=UPI00301CC1C7
MNALSQHAVALARNGHWQLIDALELIERCRQDKTLGGILHAVGSPALLGFVTPPGADDDEDCVACGGDGEVECCCCGAMKDCSECDGTGRQAIKADGKVQLSDVLTWRTLNGEGPVVASAALRSDGPWMDLHTARDLVTHYRRLVAVLWAQAGVP